MEDLDTHIEMNTMNSKLNLSFSQLFSKGPDDNDAFEETKPSDDDIDCRLASRLSTPANKKRSSRTTKRKSKRKSIGGPVEFNTSGGSIANGTTAGSSTYKRKSIGGPIEFNASDGSLATGTTSNTSHNSSSSSMCMDQSEPVERISQIQMRKETFDNIQRLIDHTKAKSIRPDLVPPPLPRLRRTQSDGASMLNMTLTQAPSPKHRKNSVVSGSVISSKSLRRGNIDDGRKSIRSGKILTPRSVRETLPNTSVNRKATRRGNSREPMKPKVRSPAPSGQRRSWKTETKTDASSSSKPSLPSDPGSTWTCECGYVLKDRMNFCGMCGTKKHWTCEDCQFNENLCQFVFCGHCGISREGSSRSDHLKGLSPPSMITLIE